MGGSRAGANDPFARANAQNLINDPALMAAVRRGALRRSAARRRSGSVMSRLAGLDPMTARFAQVQTEGDAGGQMAGDINEAQLGQMLGGQSFKRGLFNQQLGFEQQEKMARLQAKLQADAEKRARGGFGRQALGLGGRVAAAYFTGGESEVARAGRNSSGGGAPQNYYDPDPYAASGPRP
jgi:hypothetical protein